MSEILRFEQVSYEYEEGRRALTQVSLSIGPGERVAVLGENGAGKSTFFLLANGVLRPCAGEIFFEGRPVGGSRQSLNVLRRGVGLVFQDPDVQILGASVEQEISFGPMNLGLPLEQVKQRVETAMQDFGLDAYRDRAPQYLSGGEKKWVTLADAVVMEPRLLLLDEPAASLDPEHTRRLEKNLEILSQRGMALVISTHNVDFAWRWASRVLLFHAGCLKADGAPETLLNQDALLRQCGLERPLLCRVAQTLGLARIPRTVEELEQERMQ